MHVSICVQVCNPFIPICTYLSLFPSSVCWHSLHNFTLGLLYITIYTHDCITGALDSLFYPVDVSRHSRAGSETDVSPVNQARRGSLLSIRLRGRVVTKEQSLCRRGERFRASARCGVCRGPMTADVMDGQNLGDMYSHTHTHTH